MSAIPFNAGALQAPFLAGVMVCCPLYGIACAQAAYYSRNYPKDHVVLKGLVAVLLAMETAHMAIIGRAAFFDFITCKLPENTQQAFIITSAFAISVTLIVMITCVVQCFYAWRVWSISHWHKRRIPVVTFIIVMSLAACALGLATDHFLFSRPPSDTAKGRLQRRLYSAHLVATMICDLTISASMVIFLNRMRSGFKSTENVINRLILFNVNVGVITSMVAICTLGSFYGTPQTSILFTAFLQIGGKVYVNSMLVTLNSRNSVRDIYRSSVRRMIPLAHVTPDTEGGNGVSPGA